MDTQAGRASRPRHRPVQPGRDDRFFDTATHQVWAVHADTGQWLYLPDGAASAAVDPHRWGTTTWKQLCRERRLLCPYPGCRVPFASARGGDRRHCFTHPPGVADHAGPGSQEKWWHLNAKHTMARWARSTFPDAAVHVDDVRLGLGGGIRQPDVLVELPDGRRLAIELQYSALADPEWAARRASYRSADIVDVWLFAHVGPQFKQPNTSTAQRRPTVKLQPLHKAMLAAGVVPLWFNPVAGRIATATTFRKPPLFGVPGTATPQAARAYELAPVAKFSDCWLAIDDLDQCRIDWQTKELLTPTRHRHHLSQKRLAEETAAAAAAARTRRPPVPTPAPPANPPQKPPTIPVPPQPTPRPTPAPARRPSTPVAQPARPATRTPWWRRLGAAVSRRLRPGRH